MHLKYIRTQGLSFINQHGEKVYLFSRIILAEEKDFVCNPSFTLSPQKLQSAAQKLLDWRLQTIAVN